MRITNQISWCAFEEINVQHVGAFFSEKRNLAIAFSVDLSDFWRIVDCQNHLKNYRAVNEGTFRLEQNKVGLVFVFELQLLCVRVVSQTQL